MRKTAGFLKVCETIMLVLEILVAVILAVTEVLLLVMGSFSAIAAKAGSAITISGGNLTPAELDSIKPFIMIAICFALVSVVLAIIGTIKTRKALDECREERPFSDESVSNILSAARIEIIGGIFGIISSLVLTFMAAGITINGTSVANSSTSLNLTFIFHAVEKYLLYHIADYGRSLENR